MTTVWSLTQTSCPEFESLEISSRSRMYPEGMDIESTAGPEMEVSLLQSHLKRKKTLKFKTKATYLYVPTSTYLPTYVTIPTYIYLATYYNLCQHTIIYLPIYPYISLYNHGRPRSRNQSCLQCSTYSLPTHNIPGCLINIFSNLFDVKLHF